MGLKAIPHNVLARPSVSLRTVDPELVLQIQLNTNYMNYFMQLVKLVQEDSETNCRGYLSLLIIHTEQSLIPLARRKCITSKQDVT